MPLSDSLRAQLKSPLGTLIADSKVTRDTILGHIGTSTVVITVGDRTTERLIGFGIMPHLQIVDSIEERNPRGPVPLPPNTLEISCVNSAGDISGQCIERIRHALHSGNRVRLTVEGEEDLLAIPACIHAPQNSVLLYGQPGEGIVVVRVDDSVRHKTQRLLDAITDGE